MLFVLSATVLMSAVLWLTVSPAWLAYPTVFLAILWIYRKLNEPMNTFKDRGIIGPAPMFLIGNLMNFLQEGFFDFEKNTYLKYKKLNLKYYATFTGSIPIIHLIDQDMMKQVCIKEFSSFQDRMSIDMNTAPLDTNLTVLEGKHWKHVRSHVSPTFSSGKLRHMNGLIQQSVDKLVENMENYEKEEKIVDLKVLCGAFTMDAIACTLFGLDINTQKDPNNRFVVEAKKVLEMNFKNPLLIFAIVFPSISSTLKNWKVFSFNKEAVAFFGEVVSSALKDRREDTGKYKDFLQLMVKAEIGDDRLDRVSKNDYRTLNWSSAGLTRDEILGQAIIFFLAGYETTANTLTFLMYTLTIYPEFQDKVYEEIQEIIGDDQEPNYDNVSKLTYLGMCINETLRMYPQAPRIDRRANKSIQIGDLIIEKGEIVAISIVGIHYDPEYWPEPEKFIPERFNAEENATRPPFHHLPFGAGPRNCVGMRLAQLEIRFAIVKILQRFKLCSCDETQRPEEMKFSKDGTTKPQVPIKIKFFPRN